VALDAGLSVPYIANLENGRGNPTLSAVTSLATALGAHLSIELTDAPPPATERASGGKATGDGSAIGSSAAAAPVFTESAPLPDSLVRFARSARFATEAVRLAEAIRLAETVHLAEAEAAASPGGRAGPAPAPLTATRQRLLNAMAGMGALAVHPPGEADWHRLLDAVILMTRPL
jgi:transcriptional regulator with XRE-family HTH domain